MTQNHWRSAVVAGLFALHPLHVESVAWISERKDVLSTFFLFLTIGAYVLYARARSQEAEPRSQQLARQESKDKKQEKAGRKPSVQPRKKSLRAAITQEGGPRPNLDVHGSALRNPPSVRGAFSSPFYVLSLALFVLGLLTKPMLVMLPFILLLLDWWPLERIPEIGPGRTEGTREYLHRMLKTCGLLLVEKLPFFLLAVISSVITFRVQKAGGAVSASLTFDQRLANAVVSYVRYIGKMLWPENLAVLYPHPGSWATWQVIGSLVLLLAISIAVILLARKRPYLAMGWCWFVGGLVPVIGLVQVGIQSMADRYTYVPLLGLFIMLVWALCDTAPAWPWRERAFALCGTLALLACSGLTWRQVQFWRNSETLFQHAVQVSPNNYLAYNNLGYYLADRGKTAEAMTNYLKSLSINPNYEDALNNVGHALAGQGKFLEAIPYYEAALRVRPKHVEVHNNLGNALSELGKVDEAIWHYLVALKENPEHPDAHNNLGIALAMQGKIEDAIPHFRSAIRFKPTDAGAHSNLGNALAAQQQLEEAIGEYQESLRLNPNDAQAHNNLGNVLLQQNRLDQAIPHYYEALRLNGNNPEAHFNLALALTRRGKREEAIAHYREALRLKPDYAEARRQLELLAPSH
jgi:tetratricopeptide (TPR) repeat protein